jgi:hypothetical protein
MTVIAQNLGKVRERLDKACRTAARPPGSVTLIAVGKTFPPAALAQALAAGQRNFGENYLQEAMPKILALGASPQNRPIWHFIGPVQSNKAREIAEHFDWVHSVEREKIAQRLSDHRPPGLPDLNVCVQVNISGEASKSGVAEKEAAALCRKIVVLPRLKLRGLMAIPAPAAVEPLRESYRRLHRLYRALCQDGLGLDTLSAGMSDDLEDAIAEGSTMVRLGTAIFGKRMSI